MLSSVRCHSLPLRVYKASSSDSRCGSSPGNPSNGYTTSDGWVSAPMCTYPQELSLQLYPYTSIFNIEKIQVLSHQHYVAKNIDVYVGDMNRVYQYIGCFEFDDNHQTGYQLREMKTVYLNTVGCYIKLRIKQCHNHRHNVYNQVGIVGCNVFGSLATFNFTVPTTSADPSPVVPNRRYSLIESPALSVQQWTRTITETNVLAQQCTGKTNTDDNTGYSDCRFCGCNIIDRSDSNMDIHYLHECPSLILCNLCEEVVEIRYLEQHVASKCEQHSESGESQTAMAICPLCLVQVRNTSLGWKAHLVQDICSKNPRTMGKMVG